MTKVYQWKVYADNYKTGSRRECVFLDLAKAEEYKSELNKLGYTAGMSGGMGDEILGETRSNFDVQAYMEAVSDWGKDYVFTGRD